MIRIATILAALAAIGFLAAPTSSASPLTYLQALNANGITVTDTVSALRTGYLVCELLKDHNGVQVADALYANSSDIDTFEMAATVVVVSVEELCPWQDRRGETAT